MRLAVIVGGSGPEMVHMVGQAGPRAAGLISQAGPQWDQARGARPHATSTLLARPRLRSSVSPQLQSAFDLAQLICCIARVR